MYIMVGCKYSASILNKTLLTILHLLNINKIDKWFICYGTLLGMVRNSSCIDDDDDIDIILDCSHYDTVKKILLDNNFNVMDNYSSLKLDRNILKTEQNDEYASIDIYMADLEKDCVVDKWNKLKIMDCYLDKSNFTFIEKLYCDEKIYYPNNYERILLNRYGSDWMIEQKIKVPQTMTIL
jgi:phosphorylcholine metabolism protein LicD